MAGSGVAVVATLVVIQPLPQRVIQPLSQRLMAQLRPMVVEQFLPAIWLLSVLAGMHRASPPAAALEMADRAAAGTAQAESRSPSHRLPKETLRSR